MLLPLLLMLGVLAATKPSLGSRASLAASTIQQADQEASPVVSGHSLEHRWVYVSTNLQRSENLAPLQALLDRAKAAGFNGIVLSDVKLGRLFDGSLIEAYAQNLSMLLAYARALDMRVVPTTADFGYSETILWHDPNLAEGLPVRDAAYRAEGGRLVPEPVPAAALRNGGFDTLPASGHAAPGWSWQDEPGVATFVDTQVKHSGEASLRMDDLGRTAAPNGNGRIYQQLDVEPYQLYHASVQVRTQGFQGGDVRVLVLAQNPQRTLQWNSVPVASDQDWTRFDVTFNSLGYEQVGFYFGVWGGGSGSIWWDSGLVEVAGPVNMIRRPGAPVTLTNEDGSRIYEEGRDVEAIVDPRMGNQPWSGSFDLWHEPPSIRLAEGSRISEGDRVKLSFYHAASVYGYQVGASLTEPAVFDIVEQQMESLAEAFGEADQFSGWMLSHDEIRVHGWDEAPRFGDGGPGENLAENVRRISGIAAEIDAKAPLFIWSDMFDSFHNAAARGDETYYLVNGDWSGSWEGLDPSITIMNWHHFGDQRRAAAEHFASRGHSQILAGYYDRAGGNFFDRDWLRDLEGLDGVKGVMYTPWWSGFDQLEAWAEHIWGGAPEATPGSPPASVTPGGGPGATPSATPAQGPVTPVDGNTIYLPFLERRV